MKEITAIIRVNKMQATKKALAREDIFSLTAHRAMGRGKQKGLHYELGAGGEEDSNNSKTKYRMAFIPKKMLILVVADELVDKAVKTIIAANRTGNIGDGRVFVNPVNETVRVRTGERGDAALF